MFKALTCPHQSMFVKNHLLEGIVDFYPLLTWRLDCKQFHSSSWHLSKTSLCQIQTWYPYLIFVHIVVFPYCQTHRYHDKNVVDKCFKKQCIWVIAEQKWYSVALTLNFIQVGLG